ncbi:hypothetical protein GCG54_00002147 [Colletotrichum gloeosporioides]|uniref:Uncharacterized protein n=1 Tax=Colletotrichum gloeosporioides TaxID=474922 RepID=A0A8H4FF39_COLGL|nr:uncharacterized protein GCG54_00002147 [Colletotrichum gloeosporioides]KAF3799446.1 hypothetical protein GCG54_00002147 [Colletotrichum gloeosporioides]
MVAPSKPLHPRRRRRGILGRRLACHALSTVLLSHTQKRYITFLCSKPAALVSPHSLLCTPSCVSVYFKPSPDCRSWLSRARRVRLYPECILCSDAGKKKNVSLWSIYCLYAFAILHPAR